MRKDKDSEWVLNALQQWGMEAQPIPPTSAHKTPDLKLPLGDRRILIEVERKADDQQLRSLLAKEKGATQSYSGERTEDRIRAAWSQIRDFPDRQRRDFTLIWFIADRGAVAPLSGQAARARLYGLEVLEGRTSAGEFYSKPCYFLYNSIFFRFKELDAVVIHTLKPLELCLNPFSSRFELLRRGEFVEAVRPWMTVVDPVEEETDGNALIADCDIDRQDINAVVGFVRKKYGLQKPTIYRYYLMNVPT